MTVGQGLPERLSTALAGRYRIERQLGVGGMALVYLAHEAKHGRRVALKVLRPELAAVLGADRFLREIEVHAHLQHPHILPLHDSGEADGLVYYVMPYVEGESLRDRLVREKQLGIDEAIGMIRTVAGAVDYAHRQGVIHRDIKPENILLHDGQPLVADFGIALAVSAAAGGTRLTETGLSLGTPHYMSPEQATGERQLDARSDVYSLAAVLYETLVGEPPHTGPTAQAIVAKVITERPTPVTLRRDTVPPHVAAAIQKALAKLPADRFHSAAEFAGALVTPGAVPVTQDLLAGSTAAWWRDRRMVAAMGLAVVATAVALWGWLRPLPPRQVMRFAVTFPKGQEIIDEPGAAPVLSPDGTRLVYVSRGDSGAPRLWVRRLDQLGGTPLPGTEGAAYPEFSPDGQAVVFVVGSTLKTVSRSGGPSRTLAEGAGVPTWGRDGWIYYSIGGRRVWRVPGSGGPKDTAVEADSGTPVVAPSVLPNGRAVLMTFWRRGTARPPDPAEAEIGVAPLHSKEVRTLVRGLYGRYALPGYLVFVRMDGALLAAPFDPERLALTGPEIPLLEGFVMRGPSAPFSIADNGTLVYWSGPPDVQQAVWVSADGRETPVDPALQREFGSLALSPDGRRLVVSLTGEGANASTDLWVYDLRQRTLSRLTFEGKFNDRPTWTPDGRRVTFASDRAGLRALYTVPWDGSGPAQSLLAGRRLVQEGAWSHDGRVLVYRQGAGVGQTLRDIYYLRPGVDSVPRPFLATEFDEFSPALSPDDRWLVYVSNESGRDQVYVRPFPGQGGRWQISIDGGTEPAWSHDGRRIYYRTSTDLMQADVQTVPAFAVGARRRLFSTAAYASDRVARRYDIAPDGRFIFLKEVAGPRELVVVINWFEELRRRTTGGDQ